MYSANASCKLYIPLRNYLYIPICVHFKAYHVRVIKIQKIQHFIYTFKGYQNVLTIQFNTLLQLFKPSLYYTKLFMIYDTFYALYRRHITYKMYQHWWKYGAGSDFALFIFLLWMDSRRYMIKVYRNTDAMTF